MPQPLPTLLFGAFDRHNLGDLLFPYVAARLLDNDDLLFAGLVERDLSSVGGYQTRSISQLAKELGRRPLNILHVGGELLTCEAWQAAVMVQSPEQAQAIIRRLEAKSVEREAWVHNALKLSAQAPYTVSRELFPGAACVIYAAVGGVELDERAEPFRAEVITKLAGADYVSVREQQTQACLKRYGINARLVPDPAVMVAALFERRIEQCAGEGEVAAMLAAFPHGYVAFQCSAAFGDDETLKQIAIQLARLVAESGYGVVLFRAGAAPWHDDLECYQRLAALMGSTQVKIFESLNIWDICALIARSHAYCGSSLHGRIVAMAFGLPRVNLSHPRKEGRSGKQVAYAATWELPGIPATVEVAQLAAGIQQALATDRAQLTIHAQALAARYLEEFTVIRALVDSPMERRG